MYSLLLIYKAFKDFFALEETVLEGNVFSLYL